MMVKMSTKRRKNEKGGEKWYKNEKVAQKVQK